MKLTSFFFLFSYHCIVNWISELRYWNQIILKVFVYWTLKLKCTWIVLYLFLSPWICYGMGCASIFDIQFSHSVLSNSLWLHGLQHARPPCPSPTPGVHPDSCPLSQWCHTTSGCDHTLSSPSLLALNLSHHQILFKWVSSWHQVAKLLEFQL